jgi:peptidyl-prolyl cis-trans isomerase C
VNSVALTKAGPRRLIMAKKAHASHILVPSKADALNIMRNITNLKEFQRYATKASKCPSGRKGGDLGSFKSGQMVPAFEKAVWDTDIGTCSEPVRTQFGFHLIWVHSRDE